MKIYTKTGDEGTTGLLYGGRVWKDDPGPEAYGAVDEAVSALGVARAAASGDLAAEILSLERDLFVVGAELATDPANRSKLTPDVSLTTPAMVERLEGVIDTVVEEHPLPQEFVVPGENPARSCPRSGPGHRPTGRTAGRYLRPCRRFGGQHGARLPQSACRPSLRSCPFRCLNLAANPSQGGDMIEIAAGAGIESTSADVLVVPVLGERNWGPGGDWVADELGDFLTDYLDELDFQGKPGSVASLPVRDQLDFKRLVLVGVGPDPDLEQLRQAAGAAGKTITRDGSVATTLHLLDVPGVDGGDPRRAPSVPVPVRQVPDREEALQARADRPDRCR